MDVFCCMAGLRRDVLLLDCCMRVLLLALDLCLLYDWAVTCAISAEELYCNQPRSIGVMPIHAVAADCLKELVAAGEVYE